MYQQHWNTQFELNAGEHHHPPATLPRPVTQGTLFTSGAPQISATGPRRPLRPTDARSTPILSSLPNRKINTAPQYRTLSSQMHAPRTLTRLASTPAGEANTDAGDEVMQSPPQTHNGNLSSPHHFLPPQSAAATQLTNTPLYDTLYAEERFRTFNMIAVPRELDGFRVELPHIRAPEANILQSTRQEWELARAETSTAMYGIELDMGFSKGRMMRVTAGIETLLRRQYPFSRDLEVLPSAQETAHAPKERFATPWAVLIVGLRQIDATDALDRHIFASQAITFVTHNANLYQGSFIGAYENMFMDQSMLHKVLRAFESGFRNSNSEAHKFCVLHNLNIDLISPQICTSPLVMGSRQREETVLWRLYIPSPFPSNPDVHLKWLAALRATIFSTRGTGPGRFVEITSPCSTCKGADHYTGHCPVRSSMLYNTPTQAAKPGSNTAPATIATPADAYSIGSQSISPSTTTAPTDPAPTPVLHHRAPMASSAAPRNMVPHHAGGEHKRPHDRKGKGRM